MKLFLAGDVMTGRGVDQILPHPVDPRLEESWVRDARKYVRIAETANGPIARPVAFDHVWGEALAELERFAPDARIVNLETSVTRNEERWPGKGIHYRMSPEDVPVLEAARIDVCALANNHVLDHGRKGLADTLEALGRAGIRGPGAGIDLAQARAPARVEISGGHGLLVIATGTTSSGIPRAWAAGEARSGVSLLGDLSESAVAEMIRPLASTRRPGDVTVASIHWGDNWGFDVPPPHVRFARRLIDAGIDVVHGHSSHHVRPIDVYRDRLILYGCGDFVTDYEGISGHEAFRGDLSVAYGVTLGDRGELVRLRMVPFRLRRMRLERASAADAAWLAATWSRLGEAFRTRVVVDDDGALVLRS